MATVVAPGYYNNNQDISHCVTHQYLVSQVATPILERNNRRIGAVIKNNGGLDVWVGSNPQSVVTDGHVLSPKDSIAIVSATPIYAYSPSGTNTVTTLEEIFRKDP